MKRNQIFIALATLLALSAGLPALGSILPIYSVGWGADVQAYAIASGACGHVDPPMPAGERRHLTFCFGDDVEAHAQGAGNGNVALGGLWVNDMVCQPDAWGNESCQVENSGFPPDQVEFTVGPLLDTATATTVTNEWGCASVNVTLTANAEPSLTTSTGGTNQDGSLGADSGYENVYVGPSSGSVGRNATISGNLCGVTIGTGEGNGRILRGLGTTGISGALVYN